MSTAMTRLGLFLAFLIPHSGALMGGDHVVLRRAARYHAIPGCVNMLADKRHIERFNEMLSEVALPEGALALVEDQQARVLLRGVSEAMEVEKVRKAFEILYEDISPIRLAGGVIFKQLAKHSIAATQVYEQLTSDSTDSLSSATIQPLANLFDAIDVDDSGSLSMQELKDSGLLQTLGLASDDVALNDFFSRADENSDGEISFAEFALAAMKEPKLQQAEIALEATLQHLQTVQSSFQVTESSEASTPRKGWGGLKISRKSPGERFDEMVEIFSSWDDTPKLAAASEKGGRLGQVLDGCLAGSRSPRVVEALRLVYCEYSALRMAGDLIFKLMQTFVEK